MRKLSLRVRLAILAGSSVAVLTIAVGGVGFAAYRTIRTQSDHAEANAILSDVGSRVGRVESLVGGIADVSTDPAALDGMRRELRAQGTELQRYAVWLDGSRSPVWTPNNQHSVRARVILQEAAAATAPGVWARLDRYSAATLRAAQPEATLTLGELLRGDLDAGTETLRGNTQDVSGLIRADERESMAEWRRLVEYGVLAFALAGGAVTLLVMGPLGVLMTRQREQERAAVQVRLDAGTYLTQAMNGVDVGIVSLHDDDGPATLNDAARRMLGVPLGRELDGTEVMRRARLRAPEASEPLDPVELPLAEVLAGREFGPRELVLGDDATPQQRHVVVRGVPLRGHDGRSVGALITFQDVTELHVTNGLLLQKAAELGAISEATRAVLRGTDARVSVCEAAAAITGARVVSIFEADAHGDLVCSSSIGADVYGMRVARDAGSVLAEVFASARARTLSGADYSGATDQLLVQHVVELTGTDMTSGAWIPVVAAGRVLAVLTLGFPGTVDAVNHLPALEILAAETAVAIERQDLLRRLEAEAETDPLTGAANRRALDQSLSSLMSGPATGDRPLSVVMLDLDHFKRYNDRFGHAAGDALLRGAVQAWRSRLRPGDVLARYGGEEFTVVLPDCSGAEAVVVADALRALLPQGQTCSAGVATWDRSEAPALVLNRADEALYAAKGSGRNRTTAHDTSERSQPAC